MTRFNDLLVLAIVLATTTTLFAQDAVQWRVEDGGNGHWYQLAPGSGITWSDANNETLVLGAHLVTLTSQEENDFVVSVVDNYGTKAPWIGLYQETTTDEPAGGWRWVTNEAYDWTNWDQSEPNNGGAVEDHGNIWLTDSGRPLGTWNDYTPGEPDGHIIEWSADCNGDGIIDYGQILDGTFSDTNANGVPDCCDDATCLAGLPNQWRTEDGGNGHWYEWRGCCFPYLEGTQTASSVGGHLMTFSSAEEEAFVEGTFFAGWLALELNDDGEYEWTTGEPLEYTNWAPGQPSDEGSNYFLVVSDKGPDDRWTTAPLNGGSSVIIEWSADCNGDGIVDYGQILDGTLADDDGDGVPDVCVAVQWRIEDGGNGHWYQAVIHENMSYLEARLQAESVGGQLASVTSPAETEFVSSTLAADPDLWVNDVNGCFCGGPFIGGYREVNGEWRWLDGESWSYTNWHPGNPDGVADEAQGLRLWEYCCKRWVDHSLASEPAGAVVISSIIEWSADCNGDGIVDYEQVLDGTFTDCNGNLIPDVCEISDTFAASVDRTPESIADFIEFDVSAMADANDTVTLDISAVGDLAVSGEFLWVYLDNTLLDLVFVDDGAACEEVSTTLSILATEWNDAGADGSRLVKIAGTNIDPDACAEPRVGISVIVPIPFADCDDSGTWDACDIAEGLASDLDGNGVPDSCDPDCDGDGEPDAYEISSGQELDCNANEIPDNCDIGDGGSSSDIDSDGVPDDCQPDCDGDGVPDSWELSEGLAMDCNDNGYPDNCDILESSSNDIDSNGVPDECKDDCNGNGIPDYWEIKQGDVADCNSNGIPDPCDIAAGNLPDCDNDLISDDCAIADGVVADCNDNGFPDSCDIADGFDEDDNDNDIPDACELAAGDLNLDGCIDGADLAVLLGLWGFPNPPIGDLNGDGTIGGADLASLLGGWRPCGG